MNLSPTGRLLRVAVKRTLYAQLTLREAFSVLLGRSQPLMRFRVEGTPPSVYLNFAVRPDRRAALAEFLRLPTGFQLAPIRCLSEEPPFDCLTLNLYRVSGLVAGLRAEWSVYVSTPEDPTPRYMVVEAASDVVSLDPVDMFTRPALVEHAQTPSGVQSRVGTAGGGQLRARIALPEGTARTKPARQWVEANDFIYWRNGVQDRAYYGAGLANGSMSAPAPEAVHVENETPYAPFVEARPRHALVFHEAMDFVLSPWWNL